MLSDIHFGRNRVDDVERALAACTRNGESGDRTVVVAGDFTQEATSDEYKASGQFVRQLIDAGNAVIATPGNHDFGYHGIFGVGTDKINVLPTRHDNARTLYREHVLTPIIEQQADDIEVVFGAEDGFDTITRIGDDVWVSLRSTHRPRIKNLRWQISRIRKHQATWARDVLERKAWGDLRLHFVTHRSLWQTVDEGGDKHAPMKNRMVVERELFDHFAFQTFIHGHNHALRFEMRETPKLGIRMRRIGVPTLSERVGFKGMLGHAFVEWNPAEPTKIRVDGAEGEQWHEGEVTPEPLGT